MGSFLTIVPWSFLWDCWPTPSRDPWVPWQSHAHLSKPSFGRGLKLLLDPMHTVARMVIMSTFTLLILLLRMFITITFTIITTSIINIMRSTGHLLQTPNLAPHAMNMPTAVLRRSKSSELCGPARCNPSSHISMIAASVI